MAHVKSTFIPPIAACLLMLPSAAAQNSDDTIRIHGTVSTPDGMAVTFAKIMFISHGDTLSQITSESYPGDYEFDVPEDLITAIDESNESTPRGIVLRQNYPNPFNPTTTIEYTLDKPEYVELAVFNVLGQEVRRLENGLKQPGAHRIVWDGRTDGGPSAAAGLYFYRLSAGTNMTTRKMLLIDGGPGMAAPSDPSALRMSKPAHEAHMKFEIVVLKDGYETYHESGFTVTATDTDVLKDITIIPLFEPGDYFPLAVGNSWEFLTMGSIRWEISDSHINGEYSTGVIDTRIIDGREYFVLDRWTHFLPTIFWSDDVNPLVRIDDEGTFILRYGDVDIPLYPFAETEFIYVYDLYEYFMDNDPATDGKEEKYEVFKNVELEIYAGEDYRTEVWTPSGTYDNCRKITIAEDRGIVECNLYFNQDAGPVHCEIYSLSEDTTVFGNSMKRAYIDGTHYGVPVNVLNSDIITDADIAELLRMVLDRSFVKQFVPYSSVTSYSVTMTDIILTGDFPYWHLLPTVPNINLVPMEYAEINQLVANEGRIIYYGIANEREFSIDGNHVTLEFSVRVKQPQCLNFGDCGGNGITYEFTPSYGVWTAQMIGAWYAD